MSDLVYQRFMASYMLTPEEQLPNNRQEIIDYTEDVLQARGIECDKRISEMSEEQINDILEEVRRLRSKGKKKKRNDNNNDSQYGDTGIEEHEQEIVVTSN
jgi:ElaB/YqjD/DUF883 family membrane-anchored ribosome-binding protein